ncbi:MAG: alpha/beta hydrolase [Chromatiales bacterium]|jgi:alpha-beta hydrolase superfamily lysophospholipase|nr:alpha/beta hydrolase [Gammaproteobacteria bacterium]MDH3946605.1 alpha/beta hydrolase [Chromatiales bacterium]
MKKYYRDNTSWVELQRFLPAEYRWQDDYGPAEEFRPWRNSTLHVERFANPDATHKVILLHGVGTNSRLLNLIAGAPLARAGFEVVAADMPFYGMTDNRETRISWDDWVEIGAELVRSEIDKDGKPVVLYGLSAGGMLAYNIAAATRKVSGIMGMCFIDGGSPLARRRMSDRPNMDEISFKMLPLLPAALIGRIRVPMKHLVKMKALVNDGQALKILLRDKCSAGASVSLEFVNSMIQHQPAIAFEDFDLCPIILLQPGEDRWTPFSVTEPFWERVSAPKQMVTLGKASHYPIEQPGLDQMSDAMVNFIRSI